LSGPPERRYLIAGFPYIEDDKEVRNRVIQNILFDKATEKMRGCIVIGVDLRQRRYPYTVLSSKIKTKLFAI